MAFGLVSLALTAAVVVLAATLRGRFYAIVASVILAVHSLVATAMAPYFEVVWPVYFYLHGTVYIHFAALVVPALRPLAYRVLLSIPGSAFSAATMLALPWAIVAPFGIGGSTFFVPYVVALLGFLFTTLWRRKERRMLVLDGAPVELLGRTSSPKERPGFRPLRIVQITDPHLGTFMSEGTLRRIAEDAVRAEPDLVFLTGDFLTMESHRAEDVLTRALSPLRALPGRVFACMGNHDHEAPKTVFGAMKAIGAEMLIDDARTIETSIGPLEIVGLDFHFSDRRRRIKDALAKFPRVEGVPRIIMLHDPGAFVHVPDGAGDLVLSGHTHGGQLGLLSLGHPGTFVSLFTKIPDHGLWGLGRNRLYVHRGTGHYGFPIRVGVPSEESVLEVFFRA